MVGTKEEALRLLQRRGWDLASRQKLLAAAHHARAITADYEYEINDALGCDALPAIMRKKIEERLRLVREKREEPTERPWSPWSLEGGSAEQFRVTLAEKPQHMAALLKVELHRGRPRAEVLEVIYTALDGQGIMMRTCPDPRCYCKQPADQENCLRCRNSAAQAQEGWDEEVKTAVKILRMQELVTGKKVLATPWGREATQ